MRIIGGKERGRKLKVPSRGVRPATARFRQSLFDYLYPLLPEARVLDLFCGSGGLGIEALSRGAAMAHFVDHSYRSLSIVRENLVRCHFEGRFFITCQDVFRFLRHYREYGGEPFDIVFAAPPYSQADPQRVLEAVVESQVAVAGGLICLEYSRHTPHPLHSLVSLQRRKVFGETVMEIWENTVPELGGKEF